MIRTFAVRDLTDQAEPPVDYPRINDDENLRVRSQEVPIPPIAVSATGARIASPNPLLHASTGMSHPQATPQEDPIFVGETISPPCSQEVPPARDNASPPSDLESLCTPQGGQKRRSVFLNEDVTPSNKSLKDLQSGTVTEYPQDYRLTEVIPGSIADDGAVVPPVNVFQPNLKAFMARSEHESRLFAAGIMKNQYTVIDILSNAQKYMDKLQAQLGGSGQLHLILEADASSLRDNTAAANVTTKKNGTNRLVSVIPLFSPTLLMAFHPDVAGSSVVASSLAETLAMSRAIATADGAVRSEFPPEFTKIPPPPTAAVPEWFPNNPKPGVDLPHKHPELLTVLANISQSLLAKHSATRAVRALHSGQRKSFDGSNSEADNSTGFSIPPGAMYRVIYCNPRVVACLETMNSADLRELYTDLFTAMHKQACNEKKISGPLHYRNFTPPWLYQRTIFFPGRKSAVTQSLETIGLPNFRFISLQRNRKLLICILAAWLANEDPSYLRWLLSKKDIIITYEDLELFEYPSTDEARPSKRARKDGRDNVRDPFEIMDHITTNGYKITKADLDTLRGFKSPSHAVIDAYLSLLQRMQGGIAVSSKFCYFLASKSSVAMCAWPELRNLEVEKDIYVPLNNKGTLHWALAVIKRATQTIELYDSNPKLKAFQAIYPQLIQFANRLGSEKKVDAWGSSFKLQVINNDKSEHQFACDSAIFMLGAAFNSSHGLDGYDVIHDCVFNMREAVRSSLIKDKVIFMRTHTTVE